MFRILKWSYFIYIYNNISDTALKDGLTAATCFPTHVCYGGIHVGFILYNTCVI